MPSAPDVQTSPAPLEWRRNALLFAATVVSVFYTQLSSGGDRPTRWMEAASFTVALLSILLAHEFGHYIAARIHRVDASLPFFIPMPVVSPFGTMGAVIRMRDRITSRRALLDIGAAGPLAGMVFAIPIYVWGLSKATVVPIADRNGVELGESVLLRLLDAWAGPHVPAGMEVSLPPLCFAAWAGFFVTMLNLLPVAQLDGGHVAFALFGKRQNTFAVAIHRAMMVFFFVSVGSFLYRDMQRGLGLTYLGRAVASSSFWIFWFQLVAVVGAVGNPEKSETQISPRVRILAGLGLAMIAQMGRDVRSPVYWGAWFLALVVLLAMEFAVGVFRPHTTLDHPPTGSEPLGITRTIIAIVTLALFALLFMPVPMSE